MASQPADTGVDANQVRPPRAPIPSIRGKADRHPAAGILGSHVVLDDGRPRKQAARFQDLLQQPSHAYHTVEPSIRPRWLPDLSKTRARCGISRPRQYFQRNQSVFLNYSAFRGISSFTPTGYGAIAGTIGSRNNSPETWKSPPARPPIPLSGAPGRVGGRGSSPAL